MKNKKKKPARFDQDRWWATVDRVHHLMEFYEKATENCEPGCCNPIAGALLRTEDDTEEKARTKTIQDIANLLSLATYKIKDPSELYFLHKWSNKIFALSNLDKTEFENAMVEDFKVEPQEASDDIEKC